MQPLPSCHACQSPHVRRQGVTRTGVQKYHCLNPACPHPYFRAERYQSPYASAAAYQRARRLRKRQEQAGVKSPVQIGPCTLWQADCFAVFQAGLIAPHSVDLILADLPYGKTACAWDKKTQVLPLPPLWEAYWQVLKPGGAILLTATMDFAATLIASQRRWYKDDLPWEKANGTNPQGVKGRTFDVHEYVLIFYKDPPTFHPQRTTGHKPVKGFYDPTKTMGAIYGPHTVSRHADNPDGTRNQRSILGPYARDLGTGHPTRKPVALMRDLLRMYSNPGDLVLDNVMGSGTTGEACVQTDRRFVGIELNADFFTTARQRIEQESRQGRLFAAG
jgi:site-specific DNA-methyltransferase (adenine-specific)